MMKIAVVDIGSNTIKMKIYRYENNSLNETFSKVENSKLISYIQDGIMNNKGISLLCSVLSNFKALAEENSADIFRCFATASLRRAKNIDKIISTVKKNCCLNIDLISGNDEASLSFSGVCNSQKNFPPIGIMVDMGGGSTEVVCFENKGIVRSSSMNFGSLSLYLDFSDNGKNNVNFDDIKQHVFCTLDKTSLIKQEYKNAVLVGGTALAINKLYRHFFNDEANYEMTLDNIKKLYDILKVQTPETKALLTILVPDRVYTVTPGLSAYLGIFSLCGVEKILVSTFGIREGYVYEKILKTTEKTTI